MHDFCEILKGLVRLLDEVVAKILRNVGDTDLGAENFGKISGDVSVEVDRHGASTEAPWSLCSPGQRARELLSM